MPTYIGHVVRQLRLEAGMSLADLAERTHYSRSQLSRIETGKRQPSESLIRQLEAALDARGALLATFDPEAQESFQAQPAALQELNFTIEYLADALTTTSAAVSFGDVDATGLEELVKASFGQLRALGRQFDARMVLTVLSGHATPLALLAASQAPSRYQIAARYAEFAGWMAQEAGDYSTAARLNQASASLANAIGDRDLMALAHVRQAEIDLSEGRVAHALHLARTAPVDESTPVRIRLMGLCVEARVHAFRGNAEGSHDALCRGYALSDAHAPGGDEMAPGSLSIPDLAYAVDGWCALDLGRPERAAVMLEQTFRRLPPAARRMRALFGITSSAANLALGEVESACAIGYEVMHDIRCTRSASAIRQLHLVRKSLQRWEKRSYVKAFAADILDVLRRPTAAAVT